MNYQCATNWVARSPAGHDNFFLECTNLHPLGHVDAENVEQLDQDAQRQFAKSEVRKFARSANLIAAMPTARAIAARSSTGYSVASPCSFSRVSASPVAIAMSSYSFITPPARVLNGLPSGPFTVPKPACSRMAL